MLRGGQLRRGRGLFACRVRELGGEGSQKRNDCAPWAAGAALLLLLCLGVLLSQAKGRLSGGLMRAPGTGLGGQLMRASGPSSKAQPSESIASKCGAGGLWQRVAPITTCPLGGRVSRTLSQLHCPWGDGARSCARAAWRQHSPACTSRVALLPPATLAVHTHEQRHGTAKG